MIFDTDVIIWAFRGNDYACNAIDQEPKREISAVTYMELMKGAKDKRELKVIKEFLNGMGFRTIAINEEISSRAIALIEQVGLKSGMGVDDALIFATACHKGGTLLSGNYRHFKDVPNLNARRFYPLPQDHYSTDSTFE